MLFGLASGPALRASLELPLAAGMFWGVAVGLTALASAGRWVTGRPPDYNRSLVSTPSGGVPRNLDGSAVRGFDVLVLSTAPLLLPTLTGAELIAFLALAAITYLTGRKAPRPCRPRSARSPVPGDPDQPQASATSTAELPAGHSHDRRYRRTASPARKRGAKERRSEGAKERRSEGAKERA